MILFAIGVARWLALLLAAQAPADGRLGPEGSPITTSSDTIDPFRGPVIGTARMVGLGGAFVAIVEVVEGSPQNPAAVAQRQAQWPEGYDYRPAFGFTYPFNAGDFYNAVIFWMKRIRSATKISISSSLRGRHRVSANRASGMRGECLVETARQPPLTPATRVRTSLGSPRSELGFGRALVG